MARRPPARSVPLPVDHSLQNRILYSHTGILSPWTPQEVGSGRDGLAIGGADVAARDEVVGRVGIVRPPAGGDESLGLREHPNLGVGHDGAGMLPKDKVRRARDVRGGIHLPPTLREKRVLPPLDGAAVAAKLVLLRRQRNRLRALPKRVDNVHIVDRNTWTQDAHRARVVIVQAVFLRQIVRDGDRIVLVPRYIVRGPVNSQGTPESRDDNLLLERARLDEDLLGARSAG